MRRTALRSSPALILALAIGACSQTDGGTDEAAFDPAGDTCGAAAYQGYVGQRVDVLNDVELPAGARVLFPTTPATMDFNPERLNVSIDGSDTITRVYCS